MFKWQPCIGAPPVDFIPHEAPIEGLDGVASAKGFVSARFIPILQELTPEPVVHIIKVRAALRAWSSRCNAHLSDVQAEADSDSIGNVLCRKAHDLRAAAVVMASQSHNTLQNFFLGSVIDHCAHHCSLPVMVVH